jgi:hypothetical protein
MTWQQAMRSALTWIMARQAKSRVRDPAPRARRSARPSPRRADAATDGSRPMAASIAVRPVRASDMPHVTDLDGRVTGLAKPDYWDEIFARHEADRGHGRFHFLVAEGRAAGTAAPILGFVLGEVRAWEFGSEPCGWVIALSVEPKARLHGVGRRPVRRHRGGVRGRRRRPDADHGRPRQPAAPDVLPRRGDDGRSLPAARKGAGLSNRGAAT